MRQTLEFRLLVISRYFPPKVGGSSILMGNLLREFPRDKMHLIRGMPGKVLVDPEFTVQVPETFVEVPKVLGRYGWRLSHLLYPAIVAAALREHRQRRFTAVLGCWPLACDLEFAYGIHRLLRLPLYIYMHDLWSDLPRSEWTRKLVRRLERRYLQAAKTVFCITDEAAAHYRAAYNVSTYTLPHSVDWGVVEQPDRFIEQPRNGHLHRIVFCGGIFQLMNTDSLIRINDAVQGMPSTEMVCCTQTPAPAEQLGLLGDRISIFSASRADAFRQLQKASVVCVPLAFQSYAPKEVQTVFPTKVLDYLVCGRPILVHAPADSFLARDARERGWGYVVDSPDVTALRTAIQRLINDAPLQRQLVAGAWQEARRRDSRVIAAKFYQHLTQQ